MIVLITPLARPRPDPPWQRHRVLYSTVVQCTVQWLCGPGGRGRDVTLLTE